MHRNSLWQTSQLFRAGMDLETSSVSLTGVLIKPKNELWTVDETSLVPAKASEKLQPHGVWG